MKQMNPIKSIMNTYNKSSTWGKILFFVILFLIVIAIFKPLTRKEGFEQKDEFSFKTGPAVYDNFYADIYDDLVFNNMKDDYEIGEIVNKTTPTSESIILDIGSGTGHHVAKLSEQGYKSIGIDSSSAMIAQAKKNYPQYDFQQRDAMNTMIFQPNSYTHILCMYFTIYYMKDKGTFFQNCIKWLQPGGYLILHLVDRENFDPILPPGNPLLVVSPQKYAKERITHTKVVFHDMEYTSNFNLMPDKNIANFDEKFKKKNGSTRKNQHVLYMEPHEDIVKKAQNVGFILEGKVDLLKCAYEYQYLYIFVKPN